jgi:PhnB protein
MSVSYKPANYATVTPYLIVDGAADAIEYYKEAFGAEEVMRMPMGDRIAHAEIRIGDSLVMLADEHPEMDLLGPESRGGATASLMVYVEDVDTIFADAVEAGGTEERAVEDQFYGDRSGTLVDPFGQRWTIATHVEDVSPEEMQKRLAEQGEGEGQGEAETAEDAEAEAETA